MKKAFLALCLTLSLALCDKAQGQVEVNPNVQWQFVRTNEVQLITGQLQTFEFPAYKNLDYIVNLEIKSDTVDVELYIYDMQMQPISELRIDNTRTAQMNFLVDANATYLVAVRVKGKNGQEIKQVESLMSLLKRPRI